MPGMRIMNSILTDERKINDLNHSGHLEWSILFEILVSHESHTPSGQLGHPCHQRDGGLWMDGLWMVLS